MVLFFRKISNQDLGLLYWVSNNKVNRQGRGLLCFCRPVIGLCALWKNNAPEVANQSMCYICYLMFTNTSHIDLLTLSCFTAYFRNEVIPKLREYNIFFEGRKALQLTSKEVMSSQVTRIPFCFIYWIFVQMYLVTLNLWFFFC